MLIRQLLGSVVLASSLMFVACDDGDDGGADAGSTGDAGTSGGVTLATISGGFANPESAHWDATNNIWYVSNLGQPFDPTGATADQDGFISRVEVDGTVADERWVEMAGDFVGLAAMGGKLYASHGSDLVVVDIATGTPTTVTIDNAAFLNDVATGNGMVYISDTVGNAVHRYNPADGTSEVFVQDAEMLKAANGLYVDGDTLVVATLGQFPPDPTMPGGIYTVDQSGTISRLGTLSGVFDGVEKIGDNYLVSAFTGEIYLVDAADGSSEMVAKLTDAPHSLMSAADIGLDPATRTVFVPDLVGSSLSWFTLP